MHEPSLAFLKKLLETPSPSGYERPVQDLVRSWARPFADDVRTDRHGNVIAARAHVARAPDDHGHALRVRTSAFPMAFEQSVRRRATHAPGGRGWYGSNVE